MPSDRNSMPFFDVRPGERRREIAGQSGERHGGDRIATAQVTLSAFVSRVWLLGLEVLP